MVKWFRNNQLKHKIKERKLFTGEQIGNIVECFYGSVTPQVRTTTNEIIISGFINSPLFPNHYFVNYMRVCFMKKCLCRLFKHKIGLATQTLI